MILPCRVTFTGLRLSALAACVAVSASGSAPERAAPSAAEAHLPPDPYAIIGRSVLRTPALTEGASFPSKALPAPLGPLLDQAIDDPGATLPRLRDPLDEAAGIPGAPLVAAVLEMRLAARSDLGPARLRLRAARDAPPVPALDAWLDLELARAELRLRLLPEAAASARRAVESVDDHGYRDAFQEAGELLQAEALYLADRLDEARPRYARLETARAPNVRAAAKLRLVDIGFDRGEPAVDYGEVLAATSELGIDVRPWWPRAAEASIRAGKLDAAEARLTQFLIESPPSALAPLAELRLADLQALRGERGLAVEHLEAIAAGNEDTPAGALADVRLAALDLEGGEPDAALDRLVVAGPSSHVRVRAYASAIRGRAALERGRLDEALGALGRASRAGGANPQAARTRADLVRTVQAAVAASHEDGGCPRLVLRLSVRRAHLLEVIDEPGPFLRLGRCFEEIGLHETARDVYRSIPRAFGPRAAGAVALPLARASLASGEVVATRTRALAHASNPESSSEWRLLLAESSLAAGEPEPAVRVLSRLVRADDPLGRQPQALRLLARAALDADAADETIALLEERLAELDGRTERGVADALGETALLTATARRRAGDPTKARKLYALAIERLPQGWRLAEASYWQVRLGGRPGTRELEQSERDDVAAMARLAGHARTVAELRRHYGLPAVSAPAPLAKAPR